MPHPKRAVVNQQYMQPNPALPGIGMRRRRQCCSQWGCNWCAADHSRVSLPRLEAVLAAVAGSGRF